MWLLEIRRRHWRSEAWKRNSYDQHTRDLADSGERDTEADEVSGMGPDYKSIDPLVASRFESSSIACLPISPRLGCSLRATAASNTPWINRFLHRDSQGAIGSHRERRTQLVLSVRSYSLHRL